MKKKIVIFLITLVIIFGAMVAYDSINVNKDKEENNVLTNTVNTLEENINEIEENNTVITEENNIITNENNNTQEENNIVDENDNNIEAEEAQIQSALSPKGFMGSALKKVALYSNGDVYLLNYDGSGYQESNIVSKELIAKGASSLEYKGEEDDFEAIVIKGNDIEKVNTNYVWIQFEK